MKTYLLTYSLTYLLTYFTMSQACKNRVISLDDSVKILDFHHSIFPSDTDQVSGTSFMLS